MKITVRTFFVLGTVISTLTGCSLLGGRNRLVAGPELQSLELMLVKRAMQQTYYEQYKISGTRIFRECGQVHRGRYQAAAQDLFPIETDDRALLISELEKFKRSRSDSSAVLDQPGNNAQPWDPGQYFLNFSSKDQKPEEVKTSVDSLSSPRIDEQEHLKNIATVVREIGHSEVCESPTFFGLTSTVERPQP